MTSWQGVVENDDWVGRLSVVVRKELQHQQLQKAISHCKSGLLLLDEQRAELEEVAFERRQAFCGIGTPRAARHVGWVQ